MYYPASSISHLSSWSSAMWHLGTFAAHKMSAFCSTISNRLFQQLLHLCETAEVRLGERVPKIRKVVVKRLWRYSKQDLAAFEQAVNARIAAIGIGIELKTEVVRDTFERPDGCKLEGVKLINPKFGFYIVYFGGLMYHWMQSFGALWQLHNATRANIITYNYRGTSPNCRADPSTEGIIEDGHAIVQSLFKKGISPAQVVLYGRSLGGGVCIQVADRLDDQDIVINQVNERSFRSLHATLGYIVPLVGQLFQQMVKGLNLRFSSEEKLAKFRGKLLVIYHEQDAIVPQPISLKQALEETPRAEKTFFLRMQNDVIDEALQKMPHSKFLQAHCRAFTQAELQQISELFQHHLTQVVAFHRK